MQKLHHQPEKFGRSMWTPTCRCSGYCGDVLDMTGTKYGCGKALCGACTVHVDGAATRSCILPVARCDGDKNHHHRRVGATKAGHARANGMDRRRCGAMRLLPIRTIMSAAALIARNKSPTDADIDTRHGREYLPMRDLQPNPCGNSSGSRGRRRECLERAVACGTP